MARPSARPRRSPTSTDLAVKQYEAIYPQIVARAVARRIVKKGIVYGGKEMTGIEKGSLPGLAVDLAGVAWEATESADTRCWGLLARQDSGAPGRTARRFARSLPAGPQRLAAGIESERRSLGNRQRPEHVSIGDDSRYTRRWPGARQPAAVGKWPRRLSTGASPWQHP